LNEVLTCPWDQIGAQEPENRYAKLTGNEKLHKVMAKSIRNGATNQSADSQSQHKRGYDDCDRFDINAKCGKQKTLPRNLIDQGSTSGQHKNAK
jgi:hypothetical protein